jgi:hypothetical protein
MKLNIDPRNAMFLILLALNSLAFAHPDMNTSAANHDIGEIEFPLDNGSFNVPPVNMSSIFPAHDYSLFFNVYETPNSPGFTNCWLFRRNTEDKSDYTYRNAKFPVVSWEVLDVSDPGIKRYYPYYSDRYETYRHVGNIIRFNLGSQDQTKGRLKQNPDLSHLDCFYKTYTKSQDIWNHTTRTFSYSVPTMSALNELPITFRPKPPTDNTGR